MKKRIAVIVTGLLALVGCGGGSDWKPTCSASKPCAAGNYCAETPDGNVCWPDAVDPVISRVQATCGGSTTCRRDATLRVEVDATDDAKMGTVEVALSLDPDHPRRLRHVSGSTYALDIPLTELPFRSFTSDVSLDVTVRDEAGHPAGRNTSVPVTRLAWTRQLATSPSLFLWSPAVLSDGRIVVAGKNGVLHFVSKGGETAVAVDVTQANELNGPASVGSSAVWVGSEDRSLYAVTMSSSPAVSGSCPAQEALTGTPAIIGDRVVASTKSLYFVVADSSGFCNLTALTTPGQPVIAAVGRLLLPAAGVLKNFSFLPSGVPRDEWVSAPPAPSIGDVTGPPAIDGQGSVWTIASGTVHRTSSVAVAQQVTFSPALPTNSDGPIILADESAVVGASTSGTGVLRRAANSGGWMASADLKGHPAIPMALEGETPSLLVATSTGWLHLLSQSDGTAIWSQRLNTTNSGLQPPNIWTEPNATTSTAYLAGADGYLYAVIVDGKLDTSAPWPKAYHDPQNTSNAGVTP